MTGVLYFYNFVFHDARDPCVLNKRMVALAFTFVHLVRGDVMGKKINDGLTKQQRYVFRHKEKIRAYNAQYRATHIGEFKAYMEIWRAEHVNEIKVCSAAWRAKHTEEIKAYSAAYSKSHAAEIRTYDETHKEERRAYRVAHAQEAQARAMEWHWEHREEVLTRYRECPERSKEYGIRWRHEHKDQSVAISQRRRARLANALINDFTTEQWWQIKSEHDNRCVYCGKRYERLTQEHKIPLIRGGLHTVSNIVPACKSCNSRKGTMTQEEFYYAGMRG